MLQKERKEKWNDSRTLTFNERIDIGFDRMKKRWRAAEAEFTDETLTICGHPVMERWEERYMKELADIATLNGGVVLEVGFGMGISASNIQEHVIDEHIIIEANRDVYNRAELFAEEAPHPVRLMFGFWEDVTSGLEDESISGILFDTYPLVPEEVHQNHFFFFKEAYRLLRPGGILTYFSDEISEFSEEHIAHLKEAGFSRIGKKVCAVRPPESCRYWKSQSIIAPLIVK